METSNTLPPSRAFTRVYATTQGLLALVGLLALIVIAAPAPRELALQRLAALTKPMKPIQSALALSDPMTEHGGPVRSAASVESPLEREQRLMAEFIAKRYRVSDHAVAGFVAASYRAGREYSVDPLLILAVMAIESRYNPVAESHVGARGLMQIIPKYHLEKLLEHGGEHALLDPEVNILVGTQILREYTRRFGEIETALQMYGGEFDEPTSAYANKVLAEKARLEPLRLKAKKQSA